MLHLHRTDLDARQFEPMPEDHLGVRLAGIPDVSLCSSFASPHPEKVASSLDKTNQPLVNSLVMIRHEYRVPWICRSPVR
jgi:hypothetical protein